MSDKMISVHDFKAKAKSSLLPMVEGYYNGGANNQVTLAENCTAFDKYRIRPRFLIDVSVRSTVCQVLGFDLKMPIGVAPTAMQRMAHPDGEIAMAKAAGAAGTVYIMSTLATYSLEEVATAAPNTTKWFQLYIYKDRSLTEQLIRRAEKADFKAVVLTVDAPTFGTRRSDIKNRFSLPSHLQLANFSGLKGRITSDKTSGIYEYVNAQFDSTLTWDDVKWLIGFTKLPVIVKGILTAEDAIIAADIGCQGVIVSNHGGRQLDSSQSGIDALPAIAQAVGSRVVVMMDGGIRDGTDVFKAIAYGAKCVFIGRPALWGLTVDGQAGAERVLNILREEFDLTMALSGVVKVNDINGNYVMLASKM